MPEEEKKPPPDIKVTDRRLFTQSGERRAPEHPDVRPTRVRPSPPPAAPADDPGGSARAALDFEGFVQYLGQVALQQMTGMRDPVTGKTVASLEDARQTIEILKMLEAKTHGNLSPREKESLDQLLYQLKMEFARRAAATKR